MNRNDLRVRRRIVICHCSEVAYCENTGMRYRYEISDEPPTDAELAEMGLVDISKATPVESMGGLTGAMYPVEHIDDADGWFVPKGRT